MVEDGEKMNMDTINSIMGVIGIPSYSTSSNAKNRQNSSPEDLFTEIANRINRMVQAIRESDFILISAPILNGIRNDQTLVRVTKPQMNEHSTQRIYLLNALN
ncbi:hypothetical protein NHQ30_010837 [Ciborinia camelliae]|nr:hypothetical protein NHQ30_010837 [Ciborinia camelliae]